MNEGNAWNTRAEEKWKKCTENEMHRTKINNWWQDRQISRWIMCGTFCAFECANTHKCLNLPLKLSFFSYLFFFFQTRKQMEHFNVWCMKMKLKLQKMFWNGTKCCKSDADTAWMRLTGENGEEKATLRQQKKKWERLINISRGKLSQKEKWQVE